jgi:CheY-like chemotaxis protein
MTTTPSAQPEDSQVLIVTEQVKSTQKLGKLLSRLGIRVQVAQTMAEASQKVSHEKFNIVLVDLGMLNSTEVVAEMRQSVPVLTYGKADDHRLTEALFKGVWFIPAECLTRLQSMKHALGQIFETQRDTGNPLVMARRGAARSSRLCEFVESSVNQQLKRSV